MAPAKHHYSFADLARPYGITRQRAAQLVARYGWDVVSNPNRLFEKLLDAPASSGLRTRLACPDFRQSVADTLATAPFRYGLRLGYNNYKSTLKTMTPNKSNP
jgi:hypothetical protein